jgi:hypothetical protein
MWAFLRSLEILATVLHPLSPLELAELAEKHVMIKNWPFHLAGVSELTLLALFDSKLFYWKFNVAVVATELAELARKPSLGLCAFPRPSPRGGVPTKGPSWIPSWIGLP